MNDPIDPATLAGLREISGGSDEFLKEVCRIYQSDVARRMRDMREALQRNRSADLAAAAHALRSTATNLGTIRVRLLAEELEALAESGSLEDAPPLLAALEGENARVEQRLHELGLTAAGHSSSST